VRVKPPHEGLGGADLDVTASPHLAQEGRITDCAPADFAARHARDFLKLLNTIEQELAQVLFGGKFQMFPDEL
jgi:hypothetical protein